jgi:hypothetical protein
MTMGTMGMVWSTFQFFKNLLHVFMKTIGVREHRQVLMFFVRQHNKSAEKPTINISSDVAAMVVERPRTYRLVCNLVCIGPGLPRTYFIRTPSIIALSPKWPGSIRVDPISDSVNVETVGYNVRVFDMDSEFVAGTRINHSTGHSTCVCRLIHIRDNNLVRLGNQIVRVKIFSINQCGQPSRIDFIVRNCAIFVTHVPHTIATIDNRWGGVIIRFNRAIPLDSLDFQVYIADCHDYLPQETKTLAILEHGLYLRLN